jgi:hypothetical protein
MFGRNGILKPLLVEVGDIFHPDTGNPILEVQEQCLNRNSYIHNSRMLGAVLRDKVVRSFTTCMGTEKMLVIL